MHDNRTHATAGALETRSDRAAHACRGLRRLGARATTAALDLVVVKAIALFVWWFAEGANAIHFPGRAALHRRMERARAEGRPVVVAANHVSWFDDPVIPMTLYRTGPRAAVELAALSGWVAVCFALPDRVLPTPAGLALGGAATIALALFGARKVWWTLGDLVNLSDASVLRGKLALTRSAPPGRFLRALLAVADRVIPWFMRTGAVKTLFVDRRPGEEAKGVRARALTAALDLAERLEPVWIFYEGGRSKTPGALAPARRGIGLLVLGLRERGRLPLVVVLDHRGMERLIPPAGARFLSYGHRVDVRWTEFDAGGSGAVARGDAQAVADAVRETALRLRAAERGGAAARA